MKIQRGFENPTACRGGYVSIGNFDGVHRGHQKMIGTLVGHARRAGAPAVVLTFDPHPIVLLAPHKAPPALSTPKHRAQLLALCGVDCLIEYPTDRALLNLTPQEFLERIVQAELDARGLVEGPNFCFGRNRAGTIETLQHFGESTGVAIDIVPAVELDGQIVSSSAVRTAVMDGRIADAVRFLGHPYRLSGRVERGASRGLTLGFATANLSGVQTLLPPDGVYAAVADADGQCYPAAVHLGPNPTFSETHRKLEAHLIDYPGADLYGQELSVDLLSRIRDTAAFPTPEALQQQIARDLEAIRETAAAYSAAIVRRPS